MSGAAVLSVGEPIELIATGKPTFPPVLSIPEVAEGQALMHAEGAFVASSGEHGGVVLAVAHRDREAGLFVGLSADHARSVAAWLLGAADAIDGGGTKQ